MRLVVDASVACEYLLRTTTGRAVAERIDASDAVAPELVDAEVLAVLRRAWLSERVTPERAAQAVADLREWPLRRIEHRPLLATAWGFRFNASAYDALYLATAALFDAPLLTADARLARAPSVGVVIETVSV